LGKGPQKRTQGLEEPVKKKPGPETHREKVPRGGNRQTKVGGTGRKKWAYRAGGKKRNADFPLQKKTCLESLWILKRPPIWDCLQTPESPEMTA